MKVVAFQIQCFQLFITDQGSCGFSLLEADQQFAKAIQPRMASFDDPSACFPARLYALELCFLLALIDMWLITVLLDGF